MKRFTSVLPAIVSVGMAAVAVGAARPHYGGVLRVQTQAAVRNVDPLNADPAGDPTTRLRVLSLVFETLTIADPHGGLRPALATAWERDARAVVWRFHVRPGVTLHDGSPLQLWQIASALRAANPRWKVATDGDVAVVEIDQPNPDLPWELARARNAVSSRSAGGDLIGTGPFRLERRDPKQLLLRAHEQYWGGRPFVDAVQIDMGVAANDRLSDLGLGRSDMTPIGPADVRRIAQRGLRTAASRPLSTFVLVFEPHRAGDAAASIRRTVAAAIDRESLRAVVLQRHGDSAAALLPPWLSGYGPFVTPTVDGGMSRAAISALPIEQRTLTLRVDGSDPLAHALAERIAVDVRERGLTIKVQAPVGLAPRADARLLRIDLDATTPDRALAGAIAALGPRVVAAATADAALPLAAPLDAVDRLERALLEHYVVVPVVHVPELYGLGDRVEVWTGQPVLPNGAWNLANIWLRSDPPERQ